MNDLKLQKAHEEKMAKEALEAAKVFGGKLEASEITVAIKVGEGGKVFGSVSAREIAEAAKEQLGFELDKKKIQMDGPIKELGTTTVTVKLHPQVAASLKVNVKEA